MVDNQETGSRFLGKLGQLQGRSMELFPLALRFGRNSIEGRHAVSLMYQDFAAIAVVYDTLRRRSIAGNHYPAVWRLEAKAECLHAAVLDGKRFDCHVDVLINNARSNLMRVDFVSWVLRVEPVCLEDGLRHFHRTSRAIHFKCLGLGLIRFRGHLPKGGYDVPTDGRDPKRRPRRRFDDDFKAQAVRLVLDEGKSVGSVARDLDLTETALREWVKRARADRTHGKTGLTTAEREELARLRKENRILREEREILKKAAAFFATERR